MSLKKRYFKSDVKFFSSAAIAIIIASAGLTGCQTGTVLNGGYVVDQESLNLVPEGSSRDKSHTKAGERAWTNANNNSSQFWSCLAILLQQVSNVAGQRFCLVIALGRSSFCYYYASFSVNECH